MKMIGYTNMTSPSRLFFVLTTLIISCCAEVDFYSHSVTDIDGSPVSLEKYRGQVTLVVNVASECGFTDKHYKAMVRAKNILGRDGKFEILAFPCNQFGAQEPKGIKDILEFAKTTYDVNFPIFAKVNVIEQDIPAAWQYLHEKSDVKPSWNFWKYLVNHNGEVLGSWGPWNDIEEIFPALKSAVDDITRNDKDSKMPFAQGRAPGPSVGTDGSRASTGAQEGPPAPVDPPSTRREGAPASGSEGKAPGSGAGAQPPSTVSGAKPPGGAPEVRPPRSAIKPQGRPSGAKPPAINRPPGHPLHDDL